MVKDNVLINFNDKILLENFIRDIINSVYLQVRDTVGSSIYRELSEDIKGGLEELFKKQLSVAIDNKFEQHTIPIAEIVDDQKKI